MQPIYCRDCRGQNTFERNPIADIKTESGKTFMLSWRCKICGHKALTSNPDYGKEVVAA